MSRTIQDLFNDAKALPVGSRVELAERLLESIDASEWNAIDEAWTREAVRRMDEFKAGRMESDDGEEVLRSLEDRHK